MYDFIESINGVFPFVIIAQLTACSLPDTMAFILRFVNNIVTLLNVIIYHRGKVI